MENIYICIFNYLCHLSCLLHKLQLLYINHQWDEEYKELKQKHHQYRADAQLTQRENQTLIARLKMEKQAIVDRMKDIEAEKDRLATKFSGM